MTEPQDNLKSEPKENRMAQPQDSLKPDRQENPSQLKLTTARTLKWNTIDKVASQVLYAVTGIVLANVLPRADFGLVGAILVFQAFAILFVDSGFGAALLQKKEPTDRDYSTVFWFNLAVSIAVYAVLYFCAPHISDIFQHDRRLIPLSRVMFLSFIITGLGIVQTNRLMKRMDVKQIAISNTVGLIVSGAAGIWMALSGCGAWALVWQTIILTTMKTGWLWVVERWLPRAGFSLDSLRSIWRVGLGVFTTGFLNTLFLNIYSFVIGARYSLAALGDYTQADKWSKMGSASISQIFTASFVPLLAKFQDDKEKYCALLSRINQFAAFMTMPFMIFPAVMALPIFHLLFGTKWDSAVILFQILMVRGIFTVLSSTCNNYILALGRARSLVRVEVVKDVTTAAAIAVTLPLRSVEALVWGQLVAGVLTWIFTVWLTSREAGYPIAGFLRDIWRYVALALLCGAAMWPAGILPLRPSVLLLIEGAIGLGLYIFILKIFRNKILDEGAGYVFGRFRRKKSPISSE